MMQRSNARMARFTFRLSLFALAFFLMHLTPAAAQWSASNMVVMTTFTGSTTNAVPMLTDGSTVQSLNTPFKSTGYHLSVALWSYGATSLSSASLLATTSVTATISGPLPSTFNASWTYYKVKVSVLADYRLYVSSTNINGSVTVTFNSEASVTAAAGGSSGGQVPASGPGYQTSKPVLADVVIDSTGHGSLYMPSCIQSIINGGICAGPLYFYGNANPTVDVQKIRIGSINGPYYP